MVTDLEYLKCVQKKQGFWVLFEHCVVRCETVAHVAWFATTDVLELVFWHVSYIPWKFW
jgi:hypothetical protein